MVKGSTTSVGTRSVARGVAAAMLSLALTACAGDDGETEVLSQAAENTSTSEATTSTAPTSSTAAPSSTTTAEEAQAADGEAHEGSRVPCQHFRTIVDGTAAGHLTDAQAKQRARQMNSNTSEATPAVRDAAADVMTALNSDDADAYITAAKELGDACAAAGH